MSKEFDSQYSGTAQRLGFRPDLSQVVRSHQQADSAGLLPERAPLFSGMSQADYAKLSAAARLKQFARGEMLYIEGDSVHHVILLTAGVVKITQLGMRGTEVILRLGIPGDVLGVLGLFSTGRHGTTALAFRACHTLVWEAATFRCVVDRMPAMHHNLVRTLGEYLDELEARFREVATEKVAARVARQLIRLRNRIGRSVAGAVEVGISREELAQMTGTPSSPSAGSFPHGKLVGSSDWGATRSQSLIPSRLPSSPKKADAPEIASRGFVGAQRPPRPQGSSSLGAAAKVAVRPAGRLRAPEPENEMRLPSVAITVLAGISGWYGIAWRHARSKPSGNNAHRILYYVDPMHPAYRSDRPGAAPDCGMALVAVYADVPADSPASDASVPRLGAVRVDPDTQRLVGIRIALVERRSALRTLHAVGRVAVEDTRVFRVNSGVDGVIRETQGDSVGEVVKKGQKLGSYYAPDFLAASSGFLAANERLPGTGNDGARTISFPGALSKQGTGSIQGYTDRLRNLGMSDGQIQRMAETRQLQETIDIVSPADGVVIARNISTGQHFEHSMDFYRIADLSRVWVLAEVYEPEAPHFAPGCSASVTLAGGGRTLPAVVSSSLPEFESGGGSAKIRLEVENAGLQLVPEMLVNVAFPIRLPVTLVAPADAVVDSGARSRVYVEAPEGVFTPREVETGWRTSDEVEIRAGLNPGERVAAAATFLIDSESRLRAPALAAAEPAARPAPQTAPIGTAADPACGMPVEVRAAVAAGNTLTDHGITRYFCSRQCKEKFAARDSDPHRGGEE